MKQITHHFLLIVLACLLIGTGTPSFLSDNTLYTPQVYSDLTGSGSDDPPASNDNSDKDKLLFDTDLSLLVLSGAVVNWYRSPVLAGKRITSLILTRAPPKHP